MGVQIFSPTALKLDVSVEQIFPNNLICWEYESACHSRLSGRFTFMNLEFRE